MSQPLFIGKVPGGVARGFTMLGLFGLALSTPLVAIAGSTRAEAMLRRVQAWAGRVPAAAGIVLIDLGVLSILVAWGQIFPK